MAYLVKGKYLSDQEYDKYCEELYNSLVASGEIKTPSEQQFKPDYEIDYDSNY